MNKEPKTPDTSGFYKRDKNVLLFAPNVVTAPTFKLSRDDTKATQDGWAFYESRDAALAALDPDKTLPKEK